MSRDTKINAAIAATHKAYEQGRRKGWNDARIAAFVECVRQENLIINPSKPLRVDKRQAKLEL